MPKIPSRPALDLSGKWVVELPSLPDDYLAQTADPHVLMRHEEFHPRSVAWMRALAERLARQFPGEGRPTRQGPLPLFWPGLVPRNLLFLAVVLAHGFRRLLPPY